MLSLYDVSGRYVRSPLFSSICLALCLSVCLVVLSFFLCVHGKFFSEKKKIRLTQKSTSLASNLVLVSWTSSTAVVVVILIIIAIVNWGSLTLLEGFLVGAFSRNSPKSADIVLMMMAALGTAILSKVIRNDVDRS